MQELSPLLLCEGRCSLVNFILLHLWKMFWRLFWTVCLFHTPTQTDARQWYDILKKGVRFTMNFLLFHSPLWVITAYSCSFCFQLFWDPVSVDSSLDFLSGLECAAQHSRPLESLARRVYQSLCGFPPCAITFLSDAAPLPAKRLKLKASHFFLWLRSYENTVMLTRTNTHREFIRSCSGGLVTSWANLWLLLYHTKNENQCPRLRELAALLNSEMTPVSASHRLLH